jgi:hypothetical protein
MHAAGCILAHENLPTHQVIRNNAKRCELCTRLRANFCPPPTHIYLLLSISRRPSPSPPTLPPSHTSHPLTPKPRILIHQHPPHLPRLHTGFPIDPLHPRSLPSNQSSPHKSKAMPPLGLLREPEEEEEVVVVAKEDEVIQMLPTSKGCRHGRRGGGSHPAWGDPRAGNNRRHSPRESCFSDSMSLERRLPRLLPKQGGRGGGGSIHRRFLDLVTFVVRKRVMEMVRGE